MKSFLLFAFLVFVFCTVEAQRPGTLDSSFGEDGLVITENPNGEKLSKAAAIQKDDKIVEISSYTGASFRGELLSRFLPNGEPDFSFGNKGKVFINELHFISCITIQQDGKIVLAGGTGMDNYAGLTIIRFTVNGAYDSTFGTNGKYIDSSGKWEIISDITQQIDGKLTVVGTEVYNEDLGIEYGFLARFNKDGTPDKSFGDNGQTTLKYFLAGSLTLQEDGKIVCAGQDESAMMQRFDINGFLDKSFGENGSAFIKVDLGNFFNDVSVQPDGKIVAVGTARYNRSDGRKPYIFIARYTANGLLDNGFNKTGITKIDTTNYCLGERLTIQKNGKIVVSGVYDLVDVDFVVARINKDGSIDKEFGNEGQTVTSLGEGKGETPNSVGIQSDGNIIVTGYSGSLQGKVSFLARYYGDPTKQQNPIIKKIKRWIRSHTLNWQYDYTDANYFVIEQSSDGINGFKEIGKVKASQSNTYSYSLNGLIPDKKSYYRITAINTDGSKIISDLISDEDIITITISPNPVKDVLRISGLPLNQKATINIIDRNGNVLQSVLSNNSIYNMNISGLRSGLHTMQVNVNERLYNVKFVKE